MKKSEKAEFDEVVNIYLEIALEDIGPIKPWFDEKRQTWLFEHKLYPVCYTAKTKKEAVKGYLLYLRKFIEHRTMGDLAPSTESAAEKAKFDQLVDKHLKIALKEVGPIKPWFDPEVQSWVFEHELYPESYGGQTKEEVIKRYPLYLRQFIEYRLKGNLAPFVEARTRGRGGKREGAGRPIGTSKPPTAVIRLPLEIAQWLKADPAHLEQVRSLLN